MYSVLNNCKAYLFKQTAIIKLLDINFKCKYSNETLYQRFKRFIDTHFEISSATESLFEYNLIVDDLLYKEAISLYTDKFYNAETVILSYCSHEKGTLRALKIVGPNLIILYAQKTKSILIMDLISNIYYFLVNFDYLNNNIYKYDYKYFEHIVHKHLNDRGSILIHGASVCYNQNALLFIGPKRSGKTTIFFETLRLYEAIPLAVDKCHLYLQNNNIIVYGFPSNLRVLPGTLKKYGTAFENLLPKEYRNISSEKLWEGNSNGKIDFPLDKLFSFCNKQSFVHHSSLKAVILPNIRKENSPNVVRVSRSKVYDAIADQLFTPKNPEEDWWSDIGKNNINSMISNKTQIINFIIDNIPVYSFSASNDLENPLNYLKTKLDHVD